MRKLLETYRTGEYGETGFIKCNPILALFGYFLFTPTQEKPGANIEVWKKQDWIVPDVLKIFKLTEKISKTCNFSKAISAYTLWPANYV